MSTRRIFAGGCTVAATLCAAAYPLEGQRREFDVSYGRWWRDAGHSAVFNATLYGDLMGPFTYGVGVTHVTDDNRLRDRTQSGAEFSVALGRDGRGLYAVGGAGAAMRHDDGNLDALWSAGVGYGLQPIPFLSVGLETRYRVEDRWGRGFWNLDPLDRRGLQLQARAAIHFGGPARASRMARGTATTPDFEPPSEGEIGRMGRARGASSDAAALAADVVQTAIDVMGTPYQWGGTDANGFDCSGLIQYAYGEAGIIVPRVSRDQARSGEFVEPRIGALRPGDILGFSVERARITHVGLYIGDGQFIHSASRGVTISSLTATDPNSRWWQDRWVAARRILN